MLGFGGFEPDSLNLSLDLQALTHMKKNPKPHNQVSVLYSKCFILHLIWSLEFLHCQ